MTETRSVIIKNPHRLHLRVASDIVQICRKYTSTVSLSVAGGAQADGLSILAIVEMGVTAGTGLTLSVNGPDACGAADALSRYLSSSVEETAKAAREKLPAVCQIA